MSSMLHDTMKNATHGVETVREGTEHTVASTLALLVKGVSAVSGVVTVLRSLDRDDGLSWLGLARRKRPLRSGALFGAVQIAEADVIEFPLGLIGLGGSRYTLIDRNPGTGFLWLHAVDDPALALPVVSPHQFFSTFSLEIAAEDRQRTGLQDASAAQVYVTVRATPDSPTKRWCASSVNIKRQVRDSGSKPDSASDDN